MKKIIVVLIVGGCSLMCAQRACAQEAIGDHPVRTDDRGMLLPWYDVDPGVSYDFAIRQAWSFWQSIQQCNGVPYYMVSRTWDPGSIDSGIGGGQFEMTLSSWNLLYNYLGDSAILANMRFIADTYLANSLSDPSDAWPDIPYPCNLTQHAMYDGDLIAGPGVTQPDKAGGFAAELVSLYKKTAEQKYLNAAIAIANTLAAHVQPGDNENSPMPFRVNAHSGDVVDAYTSDWTGTLRLFDQLMRLGVGKLSSYQQARTLIVNWLLTYPIQNDLWGPYFEDVGGWSNTEINAITIARYLIDHPSIDSAWRTDAKNILDWTMSQFADSSWSSYGVTAILEQTAYLMPGQSHTARYASAALDYQHQTGDTTGLQSSIAQLNWATYWMDSSGMNSYPYDKVWLTDGYGDYIRHYLRAMASYPELAPYNSDHILSTSSVLHDVHYDQDAIVYQSFDSASQEVLRMTAKPLEIRSDGTPLIETSPSDPVTSGWSWTPLSFGGVVHVRHLDGHNITIAKDAAVVRAEANAFNIEVYPNPAMGTTTITSSAPARVELFDELGRVVYAGALQHTLYLNTSRFATGLYILRLSTGSRVSAKHLMIVR